MRRRYVGLFPFEVERRRGLRSLVGILLVAVAVLVGSPEGALAAPQSRWILRALAGAAASADDSVEVLATQSGPITIGKATHGVSDGSGFGLGLEFLATQRVGIELGVSWYDFDSDFTIVGSDAGPGGRLTDQESVTVETFLAGASYHFRPGHRWDISLGVFAAMAKPEDIVFNTEAGRNDKMAFDDDVGFGALVRLDAALSTSRRWLLTAELRALSTIFESEHAGQDLDLDPVTVAVGLGYRW